MRPSSLKAMTAAQLVERFVELCLAQDRALLYDEIGKYNKLFDQMWALADELKSRPGDQRSALTPLHNHQNAQVRLKSAIATLALAPEGSRRTLQLISDRDEYPQAADARGMMRALDEG